MRAPEKKSEDRKLKILDLGTGSGCLLLSCLHEYTQGFGYGVDLSPKAIQIATENARRLGLENKCKFFCMDFGKIHENTELMNMNVILCNPPYLSNCMATTFISHEMSTYEPKMAYLGF
eukprot:TRINITY_DN20030_c0_g1_i1.p1 TRINITY_DN20030_c0_g1~~TRINITY_DN20030_c0_g1_i1.p1  ORF type:complete len:119 (+),score=20.18 TRINITY_DN20030_c0_g1_i1:304-660(+)